MPPDLGSSSEWRLPPAFFWLKSYPEPMGLWISVLGSFVAAIGSTLLFNAVDAKPELVVLVYVFSRGKAHKP